MANIRANKSEVSNLLKLRCKMNKFLCCFFGFNNDKFIHDFANSEAIRVKTELMVNPIAMPVEHNVVKPSLKVVLGVKLFCGGI
jgi:hypothetical protein